MTQPAQDEDREAEARRTLSRLAAESETVGGSAMGRLARHFSAADAPQDDRIEIWGRRIGRFLGLIFVAYLLWVLSGQIFGTRLP